MAKCKNCGADVAAKIDECPDCGMNMTAQTITDLPKTKIRRKKKVEDQTVPAKDREVVCENCRTPVPGNINACPKCGLAMTAQTITDLPKTKIRREKKPEDFTTPSKDRQVVCEHCRSPVPGNINICPKCGLSMTAQTITDLPPWKEG